MIKKEFVLKSLWFDFKIVLVWLYKLIKDIYYFVNEGKNIVNWFIWCLKKIKKYVINDNVIK